MKEEKGDSEGDRRKGERERERERERKRERQTDRQTLHIHYSQCVFISKHEQIVHKPMKTEKVYFLKAKQTKKVGPNVTICALSKICERTKEERHNDTYLGSNAGRRRATVHISVAVSKSSQGRLADTVDVLVGYWGLLVDEAASHAAARWRRRPFPVAKGAVGAPVLLLVLRLVLVIWSLVLLLVGTRLFGHFRLLTVLFAKAGSELTCPFGHRGRLLRQGWRRAS